MKSIYVFAVVAVSLMLASCQSETEVLPDAHRAMGIGVSIQTEQTRALVGGTSLPEGAEIGLFVAAWNNGPYDNVGYVNVKATSVGSGTDQTWTLTSPILLSSTVGKAVAYYPYVEGATSFTEINISTDSQTDYMYSGWVNNLSNAAPNATFTMKHGLAAVQIKLKKENYTGTGEVTSIAVKSPGFGKGGTMSPVTGYLSNITGINEAITRSINQILSESTTYIIDFLIVPVASASNKDLTISARIDGKPYSATIPMATSYEQGKIFSYTLTLKGTELVVSNVSVEPWVTEDRGSADFTPETSV